LVLSGGRIEAAAEAEEGAEAGELMAEQQRVPWTAPKMKRRYEQPTTVWALADK
jgi:hypothetical protein